MELPKLNILDEFDSVLRTKSEKVTFPLSKEDKKLIQDMLTYLKMSQNEEYIEKYNLRPGMGLAYIQLGIPKNIFVIASENEDGTFDEHVIINPRIISKSEELIYVGEGEGCLSVNREVDGIVPRNARTTIEYNDINGNLCTIRVREDISVAFQHEIDHLNGIIFVDYIDKDNPFKNSDKMREI